MQNDPRAIATGRGRNGVGGGNGVGVVGIAGDDDDGVVMVTGSDSDGGGDSGGGGGGGYNKRPTPAGCSRSQKRRVVCFNHSFGLFPSKAAITRTRGVFPTFIAAVACSAKTYIYIYTIFKYIQIRLYSYVYDINKYTDIHVYYVHVTDSNFIRV